MLTYEIVGNSNFSAIDHYHIDNGILTLYPAPDQSGGVVFGIIATGPSGLGAYTTIQVIVEPVDDPPEIRNFDAWIWADMIFIEGVVTDVDSPVLGDRIFIGGEYQAYDVYARADGTFRTAIPMDNEILDTVFLAAIAFDPVSGSFSEVITGYYD